MKVGLTIIFGLWIAVAPALATGQEPDRLVYKGQSRALFANPLEEYYEAGRERPAFMSSPNGTCTANWRGYVATWVVKENTLYLQGIKSWIDGRRATLPGLFGSRVRQGIVKASWFSGELRIPDGKELRYVHMGYGSVYERDILLTVEQGRITKTTVMDNTKRRLPSARELQRQELEKMNKKDPQPNGKRR